MVVFLALAPVAEHAQPRGQVVAVGDDGAALAAGAEVLARVEAEATDIAEAAGAAALVLCTMRLGRVLDHDEAIGIGEREQGRHVGHAAMQMHRQDRPGSTGQHLGNGRRIERSRARLDIGQHRPGTCELDRRHGRDERHRCGHHLVARADAGGEQRHVQRRRASAHRNGMAGAAIAGKVRFEGLDLLAQHVAAAAQHARAGGLEILGQRAVLRLQIEQRDHDASRCGETLIGRPPCLIEWVASSRSSTMS